MIGENHKKRDWFLNFYFFMMYLFTSMPAIQFSMIEMDNPFFLIIGYGLTLLAALKYRVNFFNKKTFFLLLLVICWTATQLAIHRSYFRLSPFIIMEIISAYTIIKIFRTSIFRRFEDTTYFLCNIALIGWVLTIVLNALMTRMAGTLGMVASGEKSSSFLLYTVNMTGGIRNCGFAWEPGRTACMTCMGLMFYLLRTKCNFKTLRFLILTACVVSTLSTTGFVVYIAVVTLCYMTYHRINFLYLSAALVIIFGVYSLPFVGDKINNLIVEAGTEGMKDITKKLTWDKNHKFDEQRAFYVPQRFEGLVFSTMNVLNTNYFIGDGRDFQKFYINRVLRWKVKTSEGVLEIIVRYGIIIGLCCYYLLFRSSVWISSLFNVKNRWIFFIVFVLINISYNFWEVPVFMAIWMMPFFMNELQCKTKDVMVPTVTNNIVSATLKLQ